MKVLIVAFSTGNAMGQYLEALIPYLAPKVTIRLLIPMKNRLDLPDEIVRYLDLGNTKAKILLNIFNLKVYENIRSCVVNEKPDLIHIFNSEGYPWSLYLSHLCIKTKIPYIVTVHDPEPHPGSFFDVLNASLRGYVLKHANRLHIHSEMFKEQLRNKFNLNLTVIPHGNMADRFFKHADSQKEPIINEHYVLFFGRVEKYKGIEYLIEALFEINSEIKLVIAGAGKLPNNLHKIKDRVFVDNRFITDDVAANYLKFCKVLIMPYIQATQSSLPAIGREFNIPMIGTNCGSLGEEISKYGGLVVEPKDSNGLVKAIKLSLQFPDRSFQSNTICPTFSDVSEEFKELYELSSL